MAKRPLKVFRTSIGFQDAWVAASSRKAALEAWGTTKDLFGAGLAEVVTDPKLTKAALARPGTVIRTARGTAAQHLAAAGKESAASQPRRALQGRAGDGAQPEGVRQFPCRNGRTNEALRKERDALRSKRDSEIAKLDDRRDREEQRYRDALDDWEG